MWGAFLDLDQTRSIHQAQQPITYEEIRAWLDVAGIPREHWSSWAYLITRLDRTIRAPKEE